MRAVDYFIRLITVAAFIALLVSPDKWGFPLLLFSLVAVGLWSLLYPQGVLNWARRAHPQVDPEDSSIWWVPRFIGGAFLLGTLLLLAANWR
jgi:hypothetical protein